MGLTGEEMMGLGGVGPILTTGEVRGKKKSCAASVLERQFG